MNEETKGVWFEFTQNESFLVTSGFCKHAEHGSRKIRIGSIACTYCEHFGEKHPLENRILCKHPNAKEMKQ